MTTGISIIICFYNAEKKLKRTLEAIKSLRIDGVGGIELILVNNNSNDNFFEVITTTMSGFENFEWKVVTESKSGLSHARNKGFLESRFDLILYCDDDNWLDEQYLQIGSEIMRNNTSIAVLGGFGEAVSDVPIPEWFDQYLNYYAVGKQSEKSGEVGGGRNVVYGAGMLIRKTSYEYVVSKGFSSFSLDRKGGQLSSGGDSEICLVLKVAGFKIWYDSRLKFKHFIEGNRLTQSYLKKLRKRNGEF